MNINIPQLISILEEAKTNLPDDEYRPQRLAKIEDMILAVTSDAFDQPPPPKDIYQKALDHYIDWYFQRHNFRFKMTPASGKGLKAILAYLKQESKTKDDNGALLSFQFILNEFGRLPKWYQTDCVSLLMIEKKINEILIHLRNGTTNKAASINNELLRKFNQ